jgi:excisionase family DNA binding protein
MANKKIYASSSLPCKDTANGIIQSLSTSNLNTIDESKNGINNNNNYNVKTTKDTVPEVVKKQVFNNKIPSGERLLTTQELSQFINVGVKTIYKMVHSKRIPFLKAGKLLRFSREQIETWLSEGGSRGN